MFAGQDSAGLILGGRESSKLMRSKIFMAILFFALSLRFHLIPSYAETPGAHVRTMLEKVMAIQTDPKLQGSAFWDQRRAAIKKIIGENFDFNAMAGQALGQYGEKLNESEWAEFKALFQDLFQESYTKLVLDFLKREKILYTQEELREGQALIKTTIVRVNEEIPVDYSLTLMQGQWLVHDVTIDGVSIVRNYRQSFSRVIQRESFQSLLKKMRLQQQAIEKPS
jgi:phospholipid transport system substrate-binding protein